MSAARVYTREVLLRMMEPYGCRLVSADQIPGFELWETGWGEPFTLAIDERQPYSDQHFFHALGVIGATMPANWHDRNNRPALRVVED